jgi:hypothetical protein
VLLHFFRLSIGRCPQAFVSLAGLRPIATNNTVLTLVLVLWSCLFVSDLTFVPDSVVFHEALSPYDSHATSTTFLVVLYFGSLGIDER